MARLGIGEKRHPNCDIQDSNDLILLYDDDITRLVINIFLMGAIIVTGIKAVHGCILFFDLAMICNEKNPNTRTDPVSDVNDSSVDTHH